MRSVDPGHSVGAVSCAEVAGYFEGLQVQNRDLIFSGDCDVGSGAVGYDQYAFGPFAQIDSLDLLARCRVEDYQFVAAEIGDQNDFSIGCEFDPVGSLGVYVDGFGDLPGGDVDDGNSAVSRVSRPELLAVRCEIEAFRTF